MLRDSAKNSCILFLGQTGVGKSEVASALGADLAAVCGPAGADPADRWEMFSLEDLFPDALTIREFLYATPHQRQERWNGACDRLVDRISRSPAAHVGITLHGNYWYGGELFNHLDLKHLARFQPTLVVTLVDDIYDVHTRIVNRESSFKTAADKILLPQLLTWRWAEIGLGDLIARSVQDRPIRHIVFAVKHSARTLRQLILERDRLPIYASFPISRVRDEERLTEDQRRSLEQEIGLFRSALRQAGFTVLDPLTIDELRFIPGGLLRPRWPISDMSPMVPPEAQLSQVTMTQIESSGVSEQLAAEIGMQVSRRDFRMVDAAAAVCAYRPRAFTGLHSGGTREELYYGHSIGCAISVVHDKDADGGEYRAGSGPFQGLRPSEFASIESVVADLEHIQEQRSKLFADGDEPREWTLRAGSFVRA